MRSTIEWLATVENRAYGVYAKAADRFRHDSFLAPFLRDLASDEFCHIQFLRTAAELVRDDTTPVPVVLDDPMKAQLTAPFDQIEAAIAGKVLTVEQLVDCIINTEFSEWNDLYLFVMSALRDRSLLFSRMTAAIEQHRRYIAQVIEKIPGGRERLMAFNALPHVWRERILIVEDEAIVAKLLSAICRDLGHVTLAANGAEALARMQEGFFDVVVCDLDMPVMDGIEFFKKASLEDPFLRHRIAFFSGSLGPREKDFFAEENLRFLEKPAGITQIKQAVAEIIAQSTRRVTTLGTTGALRLGCAEAFLLSKIAPAAGAGGISAVEQP